MANAYSFGDPPVTIAEMLTGSTQRSVLPVFFYHTLEKPFCNNSACQCQKGRFKTLLYLEAVERGDIRLGSIKGDVCHHLKSK
jgi:hypothetical protein